MQERLPIDVTSNNLALPDIRAVMRKLHHHMSGEAEDEKHIMHRTYAVQAYLEGSVFDGKRKQVDETVLTGQLAELKTLSFKDFVEAQNHCVAYVISKIREMYGDSYKKEREASQIQTIIELLEGNTKQLTTGFGKSSVILPTAVIVHSLTESENPILATATLRLMNDLDNNLKPIIDRLGPNLQPVIRREFKDEDEEKEIDEDRIGEAHWADFLSKDKPVSFMEDQDKPTIFLTTYHTMESETIDEEKCWGRLPWTYGDEIHFRIDQGSPLVMTGEMELTESRKSEYQNQWILSRLLSPLLDHEDYFEVRKGKYYINDEGDKVVGKIVVGVIDAIQGRGDLQTDAFQIVSQETGAGTDEVRKKFYDWFDPYALKKHMEDDIASALCDIRRFKLGGAYTYDQEGNLNVRDQYLGLLLKRHHFDPFIEMALTSRDGKFHASNLAQRAGSIMHFETFLEDVVEGNLSSTSGTLYYPDFVTGQPIESAAAGFLKQHSKGRVIQGERTSKNPPVPEIHKTDNSAMKALRIKLASIYKYQNDSGPTLIECWNEEEGKKIFEMLSKWPLLKNQVTLVNKDISEDEAMEIYKRMGNGDPQTRIVISTGKTGMGVDIKINHQNNVGPLRVMLFNMPLTRLQVWQAIGRRRDEGDDFYWFMSATSIQEYLDRIEPDVPVINRIIGREKSYQEVVLLLESADSHKRMEGINYVFDRSERIMKADHDFSKYMDRFYRQHVKPIAFGILKEYIKKKIMANPDMFDLTDFNKSVMNAHIPPDQTQEKTAIDMAAQILAGFVNLPESLYWSLYNESARITDAQNLKDLFGVKLPYTLTQIPLSAYNEKTLSDQPRNFLEKTIFDWAEMYFDKEAVEKYKQIFDFVHERINQEGIGQESLKAFHIGYMTGHIPKEITPLANIDPQTNPEIFQEEFKDGDFSYGKLAYGISQLFGRDRYKFSRYFCINGQYYLVNEDATEEGMKKTLEKETRQTIAESIFHSVYTDGNRSFGYIINPKTKENSSFLKIGEFLFQLRDAKGSPILLKEEEKIKEFTMFPGNPDIVLSTFVTWV